MYACERHFLYFLKQIILYLFQTIRTSLVSNYNLLFFYPKREMLPPPPPRVATRDGSQLQGLGLRGFTCVWLSTTSSIPVSSPLPHPSPPYKRDPLVSLSKSSSSQLSKTAYMANQLSKTTLENHFKGLSPWFCIGDGVRNLVLQSRGLCVPLAIYWGLYRPFSLTIDHS